MNLAAWSAVKPHTSRSACLIRNRQDDVDIGLVRLGSNRLFARPPRAFRAGKRNQLFAAHTLMKDTCLASSSDALPALTGICDGLACEVFLRGTISNTPEWVAGILLGLTSSVLPRTQMVPVAGTASSSPPLSTVRKSRRMIAAIIRFHQRL